MDIKVNNFKFLIDIVYKLNNEEFDDDINKFRKNTLLLLGPNIPASFFFEHNGTASKQNDVNSKLNIISDKINYKELKLNKKYIVKGIKKVGQDIRGFLLIGLLNVIINILVKHSCQNELASNSLWNHNYRNKIIKDSILKKNKNHEIIDCEDINILHILKVLPLKTRSRWFDLICHTGKKNLKNFKIIDNINPEITIPLSITGLILIGNELILLYKFLLSSAIPELNNTYYDKISTELDKVIKDRILKYEVIERNLLFYNVESNNDFMKLICPSLFSKLRLIFSKKKIKEYEELKILLLEDLARDEFIKRLLKIVVIPSIILVNINGEIRNIIDIKLMIVLYFLSDNTTINKPKSVYSKSRRMIKGGSKKNTMKKINLQ
ncbi:MAG: hypothetical protein CBB97_14785 [Candidatus Endolissoclinum sp. TMED37]|nr:MAG: hypothetical protein CBB97_14785 [Candidatus Endolissoclinum sp. TMED37]|tara:strand:+ start:422 stop:1561 length:1140 start_codon:yes stop_codon:yes gene_type:complete